MSNKAREAIKRRIAQQFPHFRRRGGLLYPTPIDDILVGLVVEGSSNLDRFYLSTLVMPLFVHTEHLHMSWGFRLGPDRTNQGWSLSDPKEMAILPERIEVSALPFLEKVSSLSGLTDHLEKLPAPTNPHLCEALGACLARAGRIEDALREWFRLDRIIDPSVTWQNSLLERAKRTERLFQRDLAAAQTWLDQVAVQSRTTLKLGLE